MNRTTFYLLLTALCFFFATDAVAQKLSVESFTIAPNDISATLNPRLDLNNNPCGLVKVQLPVSGAQFEGNIIYPVPNKTGEYWVYMTEGSKELLVKTPGFNPLRVTFADYQITSINSKTTYVLTLTLPNNVLISDPNYQYLVLTVTPANSSVYIDDRLQAVEEGTVSAYLSQGSHSYRVESPGYATEKGEVEIGESKRELKVSLRSTRAQLTLTCPTPGVQVWLNEQSYGGVPCTTSLLAGNYVVEVRKDGFRSYRETISLAESEVRQLTIPALQAQVGNLDVNFLPKDAEVYLDGQRLGTSPDVFKNIPVGTHSLEIRKAGYVSQQTSISIADRETLQQSGRLQAINTPSKPTKAKQEKTSLQSAKEYLRPTSGYIQAAIQAGTLMGASAHVGGYIYNVNVEAFGMLGLSKETVYLNYTDGKASQTETLKAKMIGGKLGYGIAVGSRLRITPQVGLASLSVKSDNIGSSALCATVGCRVDYALTSFLGINLTPEGQFAVSKKDVFTQLSDISTKVKGWGTGAGVRLGFYVFF